MGVGASNRQLIRGGARVRGMVISGCVDGLLGLVGSVVGAKEASLVSSAERWRLYSTVNRGLQASCAEQPLPGRGYAEGPGEPGGARVNGM